MQMTKDIQAHQRIESLIDIWLPSKCQQLQFILMHTKAQIMGSFPLHALAISTSRWLLPGDMDIFLRPNTRVIMNQCLRHFSDFIQAVIHVYAFPTPTVLRLIFIPVGCMLSRF